ncbi:hypothetical protein B0H14DRAFT_2870083 [Mycena olivaceomarginata]|nr:hypothetical protein B0H14DRAFT_2870083 [Mycena olivaceomarginata]
MRDSTRTALTCPPSHSVLSRAEVSSRTHTTQFSSRPLPPRRPAMSPAHPTATSRKKSSTSSPPTWPPPPPLFSPAPPSRLWAFVPAAAPFPSGPRASPCSPPPRRAYTQPFFARRTSPPTCATSPSTARTPPVCGPRRTVPCRPCSVCRPT